MLLEDQLKRFPLQLLKKYRIFPSEFRLLKEKNGLLDLENALFISKSPDNIDLAIKDFVILSKNLA